MLRMHATCACACCDGCRSSRLPLSLTPTLAQANVVGMAIFAYSYVVTIPSWVNEKRHHVSVNRAVWVPATVGLVMKVQLSILKLCAACLVALSTWRERVLLFDGC